MAGTRIGATLAVLVAFVVLPALVCGQNLPTFEVLGSDGSSTFTLLPTATSAGSTTYHYFRIDIPHHAYLVTINSTLTGCSIASQPANVSIISYSSIFMPCDHEYVSNISTYTNATTVCQGGWDVTTGNDEGVLGMDGRFATTGLFVALENAPPDLETETVMMQASDIPVTPGGHLWVAVGKFQSSDNEAQCEVKLDVQTLTCADLNQLAFSGDTDRPTYCVPYQNVTITSTDTPITASADIISKDGYVWRIPSVPEDSNLLVFTLKSTSDSLLGGAGPHLIGAQGSTCAKDCELPSAVPNSGDADFPFVYTMTCYAPRWNKPYYFAVSNLEEVNADNVTIPANYTMSVEAKTCASGFTGLACKDPLLAFPTSNSVISMHAPAGLVHWYADVPENTWDNTFVHVQLVEEANSTTTNNATWSSLFLRQGTFSNPDRNANGYTSPRFTTYARNGLLQTPYERYAPESTRWVVTFACANVEIDVEGVGCDFSLRFSFLQDLSQLDDIIDAPLATPSYGPSATPTTDGSPLDSSTPSYGISGPVGASSALSASLTVSSALLALSIMWL